MVRVGKGGVWWQVDGMVNEGLTVFARERMILLLEQWDRVVGDAPLMQPTHGPAWERSKDRRRGLVTQGRLIHNFAMGWRITGEERWRERGRQALRGLREGFPISPAGLPVFAVEESGEVINDHICIYGVAFALFGLAHGAAWDDDPEIAATAERWWESLVALRDEHGGWPWGFTAEGELYGAEYTHNPIMHLVEAALAWNKVDLRWGARANELIAFCTGKLLNAERNAFPEYHDANWEISTKEGEDFYSIGHQWEWAHLLVQADDAGLSGGDLDLARSLSAEARRVGSPQPDYIISRVFHDGRIQRDDHFYWDYCEAARACLWLGVAGGAPEYLPLIPGLMQSLEKRCYDPINHGYSTFGSRTPTSAEPKGSVWKVDYHQIALFTDLIEHEDAWLKHS